MIHSKWKKEMKVPRLWEILGELGLNNRGKRDVLVKRLDEYLDKNAAIITPI